MNFLSSVFNTDGVIYAKFDVVVGGWRGGLSEVEMVAAVRRVVLFMIDYHGCHWVNIQFLVTE